jgi:hypothetical protein
MVLFWTSCRGTVFVLFRVSICCIFVWRACALAVSLVAQVKVRRGSLESVVWTCVALKLAKLNAGP